MISRYCWLAAVGLFVAPADATAQVWFPGPKPTRVRTYEDPDGVGGRPAPMRCYVHWDQAEVYADPRDPGSVRFEAAFLSRRYDIGADYVGPDGERFWLLVDRVASDSTTDLEIRDTGYHGWVRQRHCLAFFGPRPAAMVSGDEIYRKCMLINTLADVERAESLRERVMFHMRPDRDSARQSRSLFEIYYVFDETEDRSHCFLGMQSRLEADSRPGEAMLGWVAADRLCEWDTREAVEFNKEHPRRQPARIFRTRDELAAYLSARPTRTAVDSGAFEPGPIASEELDAPPLKHFQPRFPLISDRAARDGFSGQPIDGLAEYGAVYRVGVIGDVRGRDGQLILTGRKADLLRHDIQQLKEQVRTVQVMFVIDATRGMSRWFKAARQAADKIMSAAQALGAEGGLLPDVEFSVNFYRDRRPSPDAPPFVGHPFTGALEAQELLDKAAALGGWQPLDAVYRGLSLSVRPDKDRPAFKPNAIKILVLIGDDGNDPDDTEFPLERVVEDILAAGGPNPIGFYAVSVGDQTRPEYRRFTEQARELARRLTEHEVKLRGGQIGTGVPDDLEEAIRELSGDTLVSTDPDRVVAAIHRRFDLAVKEMAFKQAQLDRIRGGIVTDEPIVRLDPGHPLAAGYGVVWERQVLDDLKQKGLDQLLLAREGVQLFQTGWAAEFDPRGGHLDDGRRTPQFRTMYLFERDELLDLETFLNHALRDENWSPESVERTWGKMLDLMTRGDLKDRVKRRLEESGDPRKVRPVDLMTKMVRGVKVRNGLLRLSVGQLSDRGAAEISRLERELTVKANKIRDALEEQQAEYSPDDPRRPIDRRERKLWWGDDLSRQGRGLRAWIEAEMLP